MCLSDRWINHDNVFILYFNEAYLESLDGTFNHRIGQSFSDPVIIVRILILSNSEQTQTRVQTIFSLLSVSWDSEWIGWLAIVRFIYNFMLRRVALYDSKLATRSFSACNIATLYAPRDFGRLKIVSRRCCFALCCNRGSSWYLESLIQFTSYIKKKEHFILRNIREATTMHPVGIREPKRFPIRYQLSHRD